MSKALRVRVPAGFESEGRPGLLISLGGADPQQATVQVLQARGWDVEGPLPADTLFFRAGRGDFDVVVAMYHTATKESEKWKERRDTSFN